MRLATRPSAPRLARVFLSALALMAVCSPLAPASPAASAAAPVAPAERLQEVANFLRPEVRLRKLHLVRPDLIQYPLSYDVYC